MTIGASVGGRGRGRGERRVGGAEPTQQGAVPLAQPAAGRAAGRRLGRDCARPPRACARNALAEGKYLI